MDHAVDRAIDVLPWPVLSGLVVCYVAGWVIRTWRRQPNWSYTFEDTSFRIVCGAVGFAVAGFYAYRITGVLFPTGFAPNERGIYVAKFKTDEKNVAQSYVIELINLEVSRNPSLKGVHVRPIEREFESPTDAAKLCSSTHATICVWGVFIPPKPVFVKISTPGSDAVAERLFDDYLQMRELGGLVVQAIGAGSTSPDTAAKDNALETRLAAVEMSQRRIEATLDRIDQKSAAPPDHSSSDEPNSSLPRIKELERRRRRFALVIGISNYGYGLPQLLFAAADAKAVADEFGHLWSQHSETQVLIDKDATRKNILAAMDKIAHQASPEDQVWIYLSGHTISQDGRSVFLPFDGDSGDLQKNGIDLQSIFEWLKRIPASQGAMFVDTCYSGAFIADYSRGISAPRLQALSNAKGQAIFSATGQDQLAFESVQLGHGLFTRALLDGLQGKADLNHDGVVVTQELSLYIRDQVARESASLGFHQSPSFYLTGFAGDMVLATNEENQLQ
jgi:caspase domain-containing protein